MNILIISGSLRPGSHSRLLCRALEQELHQISNQKVTFLDLRDYPLPLCDGDVAYNHPNVDKLRTIIAAADAVVFGIPIYNYDINAAIKNLVELTGRTAWENQVVGFLCAAGGKSSYMSVMNFANDLMLDFRCIIIPRFIYATRDDFTDNAISNPEIRERLQLLANEACQLARFNHSR